MIAALTTGDVPSLIVAYQNQAAAYQVADGLVAIDPYITDPVYGLSEEERADFFQSFIEGDRLPQFDNEVFGFPVAGRSMEVLFYNADWLAELGYDAPPQTPEEFVEMTCAGAATAFSKNESGFTTGMELSTDASAFASWVFARNGDIFDLENLQFTYNTPEANEAMTMLQNLYTDGCISQIAEQYGDQTDFGNGKTLFTTSSSSGLPFYAGAVDDGEVGGFAWSVAPFPYTGDTPVQNIYGASTSIVKTDPQTQLASWLFLKFLSSPENAAKWVPASDYFPARASVAAELSDYIAENEAFGTAFDLLQYGKAEAPVAGYDPIRDDVSQAFTAIVFDGADVESTLAALEETANQKLADAAP
jgi:multiple sugar transport system substrate-binding protein/sn-glycerol 3-phosphate transport system substrate-binding protein